MPLLVRARSFLTQSQSWLDQPLRVRSVALFSGFWEIDQDLASMHQPPPKAPLQDSYIAISITKQHP